MTVSEETQNPEQRKCADRSLSLKLAGAGLMLLGALLIVIAAKYVGASFETFSPPSEFSLSDSELKSAAKMNSAAARSVAVTCLLYAGISFWLGRGSLHGRKWACRILATLGAVLLAYNIFMLFATFGTVFLPMGDLTFFAVAIMYFPVSFEVMEEVARSHVLLRTMLGALILLTLIGVPLAASRYYRSPNVRATCAARDESRDWTATCPEVLLALCILWGLYVITHTGIALSGRMNTMGPFHLLGASSMLVGAVLAAWFALLVVGTFRANRLAYAAGILTTIALGIDVSYPIIRAFTPTHDAFGSVTVIDGGAGHALGGVLTAAVILWYAGKYFMEAKPVMESL